MDLCKSVTQASHLRLLIKTRTSTPASLSMSLRKHHALSRSRCPKRLFCPENVDSSTFPWYRSWFGCCAKRNTRSLMRNASSTVSPGRDLKLQVSYHPEYKLEVMHHSRHIEAQEQPEKAHSVRTRSGVVTISYA